MLIENILLNDEYWSLVESEDDKPDDYDDYWADYGRDEIDDDF